MTTHYRRLTHDQAREIASSWHGGQGSPLYALASSGAIVDGVVEEIDECAESCKGKGGSDFTNLIDLRTYVRRRRLARGPVAGWADLA